MAQGPPSSTSASLPVSPSATCWALVGLTRPDGLALGATTGRPTASSSRLATGWAGTRSAMVSRPAQARSETGQSGRRFSTMVSGPGQKAAASFSASGVNNASSRARATSGRWEISGLKLGLPLAAKMAATARPSVASPPSP